MIQLAEQELQYTGWALDWQGADWLVPAGAWSYERLTPMGAVKRLAEAAGAYVQPDLSSDVLRVFPRYSVLPWDWANATPDIGLAADILVQEGIKPTRRPDYNQVHVTGQSQGITGRVRRQGTAGDIEAPMIVDPLCTHVDGARARGEPILAGAGTTTIITVSMPMTAGVGLVEPGKLLEVTEGAASYRALARGARITAWWDKGLKVRHYMELERHA